MADPYAILGVSKGASEKDIKSAYRKLAKELHPDYNKDNATAAARFSEVTRAYDLLSDKDKRARFDRGEIDIDGNPAAPFGFGGGGGYRQQGRSNENAGFSGFGNDGVDFADIFDGLFGGLGGGGPYRGTGRSSAPKGANVAYKLAVDFTDAAALKPQRITLADGKTIDLKLPNGVETGTNMRLSGKGQSGPGGPGDGIVTIEVRSHRFFRRDGDNVRLDLPITLKEAVAGGEVRVPTVDGAVMLKIKPGSQSGQQLRLKGKGFHNKAGVRGDQIIELQIRLPEGGDAALSQFVENWSVDYDPRSGLAG
ncbi:DnaJ C-terminal domain-containing protein [Blastomonas sp. AAP53]|uniref:DnaJ C-terminal domain-containing protein n=1 Tax=Blastomonas sp. AAP53 TaxID=1248760 RepID=UPI00047708DD|nr:DnaJ C-terminal domain-containing protein [Blastomonas sp. AAP53]